MLAKGHSNSIIVSAPASAPLTNTNVKYEYSSSPQVLTKDLPTFPLIPENKETRN